MKDLSLGGCYPAQPSASMVNILLDLHNSSYPTQPHSTITNQTGYTHAHLPIGFFLLRQLNATAIRVYVPNKSTRRKARYYRRQGKTSFHITVISKAQ